MILRFFYHACHHPLAFIVDFLEMNYQLFRFLGVVRRKKFEGVIRHAHTGSGIDPWRNHEGDIVFCKRFPIQIKLVKERREPRPRRLSQYIEAEARENPVLPHQRHHVRESGDAHHVERPLLHTLLDADPPAGGFFFRQYRLHQFEGDSRATNIPEGIFGVFEFWIHYGKRFWQFG